MTAMPDLQQPTDTQKLGAIEDRVAELMRRTDTLVADAAVARVQARRDAVEEPKSEPKADDGDERLRTLIRDEIRAALKHAVAREPEEEREGPDGAEIEPQAADDDRIDALPNDPHFEGKPAWAENPHRADARRDSRADARHRRDRDELDLYEAQSQFNEAYQAVEGTKAPLPISGHSALTYRVYAAKPLQKYSETWKHVDLLKLAKSTPDVFRVADTAIRADCIRIGGDSRELAKYKTDGVMQREIRRTDRTGRVISEFVGPVDAVNGMFAPFDLPPRKFRGFNRNPNAL
jgi:hypothetical protein